MARLTRPPAIAHDWEMTLLSPTKFINFVDHRCIGTWVEG